MAPKVGKQKGSGQPKVLTAPGLTEHTLGDCGGTVHSPLPGDLDAWGQGTFF